MPRKSADKAHSRPSAKETDWYTTPQGRRQTEREFPSSGKSAAAEVPAGERGGGAAT